MHEVTPAQSEPAVAIEIEGLGIAYRRYLRRVTTLKGAVTSLFRGNHYEQYWALRNVSLKIYRGERVGIIGPNGSGKSTLLKAIAGILPTAEGTVLAHGRIAPLIELGGGFRPDLTGRENIFLNGAIMGVSSEEMRGKEEEIIDFADIGDFIDAPLSTYSSGMRARLGFAVASDVDPDILLLDEVFSVGDAVFKKKAIARTESFFQSGRTVITVSHTIEMMPRLCDRVIYLRSGKVVADGPPKPVIERYRRDTNT